MHLSRTITILSQSDQKITLHIDIYKAVLRHKPPDLFILFVYLATLRIYHLQDGQSMDSTSPHSQKQLQKNMQLLSGLTTRANEDTYFNLI